jgi:1-acyl-sn-glycerol-3-phosphate acyltransferase
MTKATDETPIESSITPLLSVVTFGGRVFARAMTRVRIEGAIDELPKEGPLILAANHASNLDGVVLGAWLIPKLGRRIHWLGKKELFDWPIVGWVATNGGVHPVDRGTADIEAFRLARRILEEGHVLFVFPEGTRSPDGSLQQARDGVASLALRTGVPIVPIGIAGSNHVWPRGQKLPHPGGHVTVRIGRPFRPADVLPSTTDRRSAKARLTTVIMELHRGAAAGVPAWRLRHLDRPRNRADSRHRARANAVRDGGVNRPGRDPMR